MQKISLFSRAVSLILTLTMLMQFLTGCSEKITDSSETESTAVTETSVTTVQSETVPLETILTETETSAILNLKNTEISISDNWEDYVGNLDAFVYGLMLRQYQQCYRTFNARITLSDGTDVFGIGYTDYAEYFESDNIGYFPAGFLALIGEPEIPPEEFENSPEIQNLDYSTEDTKFLYAYETAPYLGHCVIWGEYLQYGVDKSGAITYAAQNYEKGICDKTLGSLYSYDDDKYLYDADVGNYVDITGESLSQEIDYAALEAEVNRILEEQDFKFSRTELTTTVHLAQEAVISYLLSLQEETFLDVKVSELVRLSRELDPMQCIQITPDGMIYVDMGEKIPDKPDAKTKWLVGAACGIVIGISIGVQCAYPVLAPFTKELIKESVSIFIDVVIQNQSIKEINWKKVAASVCIGTVANIIPGGKLIKAGISGIEETVYAVIDTKSPMECLNATVTGIISGLADEELGEATKAISDNIHLSEIWKNFPDKITKIIDTEKIEKAKEKAIEELLERITELEVPVQVVFEMQSQLHPDKTLTVQLQSSFTGLDILAMPELLQNNGNFTIFLTENENPELIEISHQYHTDEIKVKNGMPDLSVFAEYQFTSTQDIISNRVQNLQNYYYQLSDEWSEHPELLPEKLKSVLNSDFTAETVRESLLYANLTFYESMDGVVYLIDRDICKNIGYYGNIALTKSLVMLDIANDNFNQFITRNPKAVTGTLIWN